MAHHHAAPWPECNCVTVQTCVMNLVSLPCTNSMDSIQVILNSWIGIQDWVWYQRVASSIIARAAASTVALRQREHQISCGHPVHRVLHASLELRKGALQHFPPRDKTLHAPARNCTSCTALYSRTHCDESQGIGASFVRLEQRHQPRACQLHWCLVSTGVKRPAHLQDTGDVLSFTLREASTHCGQSA